MSLLYQNNPERKVVIMSTARQELPSSPPQMTASLQTPKSVLNFRIFLSQFFKLSVVLFIASLMLVAGGAVYYKTAQVQRCWSDHILGVIPAGRTCVMERRF